jgi:prephenate dehydratase
MKVGFQGHSGAYSELALREYFGNEILSTGFDMSESVFEKLDSGELDVAFLPIENSIVGNVAVNIDLLNTDDNFIIGEHYLNINHCILAKPGIELKDVKFAHSHPVALAQCRDFLKKHNITPVSALDTAGAAKKLSQDDDRDYAVICSSLCSDYYKLNILEEKIQTVKNNITRFVAVVKKNNIPADLEQEKTSLSFSANHEPGALMKCLQIFSNHNINLTKLESRPVPTDPFHYTFFVDFIGCPQDPDVEKCLMEMKSNVQYIRVLGSYPNTRKR